MKSLLKIPKSLDFFPMNCADLVRRKEQVATVLVARARIVRSARLRITWSKRIDRQVDRGNCITSLANAVGKYCKNNVKSGPIDDANERESAGLPVDLPRTCTVGIMPDKYPSGIFPVPLPADRCNGI